MLKKLMLMGAFLIAAVPAFAAHSYVDQVEAIALRNGSTLYVFSDGKMAMADALGRAYRMKPGQSMETRDGKVVVMVGDEVQRLHEHLTAHYGGG